jgi:hypothetical protein
MPVTIGVLAIAHVEDTSRFDRAGVGKPSLDQGITRCRNISRIENDLRRPIANSGFAGVKRQSATARVELDPAFFSVDNI